MDDETKARLAHLEAIEAAMGRIHNGEASRTAAFSFETVCMYHELHDLIREGMKDNG